MANNPNKNWDCCNDKCRNPHGPVKVYPLGSGANLILCEACFAHENSYRAERRRFLRATESEFPQHDWRTAEPYGDKWGVLACRAGGSAWAQRGERVILFDTNGEAESAAREFNRNGTFGITYKAARYE